MYTNIVSHPDKNCLYRKSLSSRPIQKQRQNKPPFSVPIGGFVPQKAQVQTLSEVFTTYQEVAVERLW